MTPLKAIRKNAWSADNTRKSAFVRLKTVRCIHSALERTLIVWEWVLRYLFLKKWPLMIRFLMLTMQARVIT